VKGSSPELRIIQLGISLKYFQNAPLWGNGRNYIWDVVAPDNPLIKGAESIWFSLLVDYGLMGCISFIFLIISCMVVLWKRNHLYAVLPLVYIFGKTITLIMEVDFDLLLIFTILLLKIEYFYKENRL
jgi:hypothetical protein